MHVLAIELFLQLHLGYLISGMSTPAGHRTRDSQRQLLQALRVVIS